MALLLCVRVRVRPYHRVIYVPVMPPPGDSRVGGTKRPQQSRHRFL